MKKLLIGFLFSFLFLFAGAQQQSIFQQSVTNSGVTKTFTPSTLPNVVLISLASNLTLTNDVAIYTIGQPSAGRELTYFINGTTNVDLNGHTFQLEGSNIEEAQLRIACKITFLSNGSDWSVPIITPSLDGSAPNPQTIDGKYIVDGTLSFDALDASLTLADFDTVGRGRILLGNSTNTLSSYYSAGSGKILIGDGSDLVTKSVTGDITLTSGGVTYIDSATIRDSSIATGAAIKWQKLATGTASYVAVTNSSGYLTTEQYLLPIRGGTGINTNASTGFATVSAGTWSVGSLTDVRDLHVSFAASSQGTYYITFPVAVTVTNIEARVETALAATDSATLQIQNDAGTNMTGDNLTSGLLVMAASATTGTGYTSTLTTNNTFTAGQRMRIITNKGTAGGTANIQVTYTRNN